MLKIKDNVDLEILKRYKFKHEKDEFKFHSWDYWEYKTENFYSWDYWECKTENTECIIETKDKQLTLYGSDDCENDIDFLYDMIVDGIVEKVGEID